MILRNAGGSLQYQGSAVRIVEIHQHRLEPLLGHQAHGIGITAALDHPSQVVQDRREYFGRLVVSCDQKCAERHRGLVYGQRGATPRATGLAAAWFDCGAAAARATGVGSSSSARTAASSSS